MQKSRPNKDQPFPVRLEVEDKTLMEELREKTGLSHSSIIRASVRLLLAYVREHGALPLTFSQILKKAADDARPEPQNRTGREEAARSGDSIKSTAKPHKPAASSSKPSAAADLLDEAGK